MDAIINGCPKCNHRGYIIDDNGNPKACECIKQYRKVKVYERVGIPRHLMDATINDFYPKQDGAGNDLDAEGEAMKTRVRKVVGDVIDQMPNNITKGTPIDLEDKQGRAWRGNSILISGGKRSGKSLLVACLAKSVLDAGGSPKIIHWPDVVDACFDNTRDDASRYANMQYIFRNFAPIFIENFSTAKGRDRQGIWDGDGDEDTINIPWFVAGRIDSLLSHPHSEGKLIVMTSSQFPKDMLRSIPYAPITEEILVESAKLLLPTPKGFSNDDNILGEMN